MKKKIVLWLEDYQVEAIHALAATSKRSISSAASVLFSTRSETDPVMVTLQQIQAQLAELQLKASGTRAPELPVTKPTVRVVSDKPASLATNLAKKMNSTTQADVIPYDQLESFMDTL